MELLKYYQIKQELARKILHPVYFFYGEEDFLQDEIAGLIIDRVLGDASGGLGAEKFSGPELSVEKFSSVFQGMSFFNSKKVIIIENTEKINNSVGEEIVKFLEEPQDDSCLIFKTFVFKLPAKNSLIAHLKKNARSVIFYRMFRDSLARWIKDYAKKSGYSVEDQICGKIADICDNNLRAAKMELDKLMAYTADKKTVALGDVKIMTGGHKGSSVFDLGEFFFNKDVKKGLECLDALNRMREYEMNILSYLSKTVRRFVCAKLLSEQGAGTNAIAEKLGLRYESEKNMLQYLRKFTLRELSEKIAYLADAEYRIKTGSGTPKIILSGLWLKLCS